MEDNMPNVDAALKELNDIRIRKSDDVIRVLELWAVIEALRSPVYPKVKVLAQTNSNPSVEEQRFQLFKDMNIPEKLDHLYKLLVGLTEGQRGQRGQHGQE